MRIRLVFVALASGVLGCTEREVPVVVPPVLEALDAGPPDAGSSSPVVTVMSLPEDPVGTPDIAEDATLRTLLVRDPDEAERRLAALETPTQWQLAILANFALRRGERGLGVAHERGLPTLAEDSPVNAPGHAWVNHMGTPLRSGSKKSRKTVAELPLATPVEVVAVDGGSGMVFVELAWAVEFAAPAGVAPDGAELPSKVDTRRFEGEVELSLLSARQPLAADFVAKARTEIDTERAAALWLRALQLEPNEETRRGLIDAAFSAHRPSLVVTAALERPWIRAHGVELAWGCVGDPRSADWSAWPPRAKQKQVCVMQVDAREGCPEDDARRVAARERDAKARQALGLLASPVLRVQVDGRRAHRLLLATSEAAFEDPCAEFREVKVAGWNGSVRQLAIPPGVPSLALFVPVARVEGVEYEIISAASLSKAASWLRSRSHVRWTRGHRGQLDPSLKSGDQGFRLERDVAAVTWAELPARSCTCR